MAKQFVHQGIAINITVKNTFLDVKGTEAVPPWRRCASRQTQRSSSVPRAFKPAAFKIWDCKRVECSDWDDSTNASDKGVSDYVHGSSSSDSEQDFPDCCSDSEQGYQTDDNEDFGCYPCVTSWADEVDAQEELQELNASSIEAKGKVTLSLVDMVSAEAAKARCKLQATARPFKSVRAPPSEVTAMMAHAVEVLSSIEGVIDVQVNDGGMGGTTMILTSCDSRGDANVIASRVQDALLSSAEQSNSTYVLGYDAKPFNKLDSLSFSTTIACVPAAHQDTACWDTYSQGFCPRRATCRWCHPSETDMMRIIVMTKMV